MLRFFSMLRMVLTMASMVSSTGILLPLYVWPVDDSTWSPVYKAIHSHPDIRFQVIINPDNGPGSTTYPDENYISGVAKLNSYHNVEVLGYIPTNYAERDASEVKKEIATYSNWASHKAKNMTVSGVFFDEAPNTNDKTKIAYMQRISRSARANNLTTVVFNPGATLEEWSARGYFKAADLIVEFENSYAEWMSTIPAKQFSTSEDYSKDAIILYSAPLDTDYNAVVLEAQSMGLGAAYLTRDDNYMSVDTVMKVAASFMQT